MAGMAVARCINCRALSKCLVERGRRKKIDKLVLDSLLLSPTFVNCSANTVEVGVSTAGNKCWK